MFFFIVLAPSLSRTNIVISHSLFQCSSHRSLSSGSSMYPLVSVCISSCWIYIVWFYSLTPVCIPAACFFFDLMSFCPQQNCQIRVRPNGVFSGNSDGECCFAADQGNVLLFDGRCVLSANNRY